MEPFELPLWPDGPTYTFKTPCAEVWLDDESMPRGDGYDQVIGNVSEPTLMVYRAPADKATRTACIVAPGGAYSLVYIDKEGYDVARWLNSVGVTAFVLKYRVRPDRDRGMEVPLHPGVWGAILSDGQRAVRTVRARAAEWGIDPQRVGMFGFSAGGHLTASVALHSDAGDPEADDPIERVSCRPDFIGLIYGAFAEWREGDELPALPPLFMTQGNEDTYFQDPDATWMRFARLWAEAGVPLEVHHYAKGAHGYGIGVDGGSPAGWPAAFMAWLQDMGMVG